MKAELYLDISQQPDATTCGPTCLHAVYRYYNDPVPLKKVISEVPELKAGGTLAVYLACHALNRGYRTAIITHNLQIFDPTWSDVSEKDLVEKLEKQAVYKKDLPGFAVASSAYRTYLKLGGKLRFETLTAGLIRRYLKRSVPLLTGLSATYLYDTPRERVVRKKLLYDDIKGDTQGHFVVLAGYDTAERSVLIADPLQPNPMTTGQFYHVNIYRLICAIMLGVLTYDGDVLIVEPRKKSRAETRSTL
jgi:hypothetical protein